MKVLALVSGGKDSCFNMMKCVENGHEIVALGHLRPPGDVNELDSYMYQSVGYHGIALYAEAMGLPLFEQEISGTPIELGSDYEPTQGDEVEDLFKLLKKAKDSVEFQAISVGAIFSDYQRVRAQNVCDRLNLEMLAYLWHRDQKDLLKDMIDSCVNARIIKVAAMGLDPNIHLGKTLEEIFPIMVDLSEKYGLNICGEGGEFESFTLDCPLFKKRICVDKEEVVIHSKDAFAPVGYLVFKELHLEDKP